MTAPLFGIDLGGTQIKGCAVSHDGQVLAHLERETSAGGVEALLSGVRGLLDDLTDQAGVPAGVGLAAPGIAAIDHRSIATMPGRLEGLEGLDWGEQLALGQPVAVLNDAHAFVLGEAWAGAARERRNVIGLTLGTGVGGGVLVDGALYRGATGRAGHLGHLSLNPDGPLDITNTPGSLEDAIGECSLPIRSGKRFARTVDLLAAAAAGDAHATEVWAASVRALAAAVASLINAFDPEAVVIGGGVSQAGDALLAPLRERLEQIEWRPTGRPVPVLLAELGAWSGAVGAAKYATHEPVTPATAETL